MAILLQVDLFVSGESECERSRFQGGRQVQITPDFADVFSSPEDVILMKLEFFNIGASDRHLRDIAGLLKVSGQKVDRDYIARYALFGVADIWQRVLAAID
jgi:hypothetical protein